MLGGSLKHIFSSKRPVMLKTGSLVAYDAGMHNARQAT